MSRIDAMHCRRARRVPKPAKHGFAPGANFAIVVVELDCHVKSGFETNRSDHFKMMAGVETMAFARPKTRMKIWSRLHRKLKFVIPGGRWGSGNMKNEL
jgi:hypothetical protein